MFIAKCLLCVDLEVTLVYLSYLGHRDEYRPLCSVSKGGKGVLATVIVNVKLQKQ